MKVGRLLTLTRAVAPSRAGRDAQPCHGLASRGDELRVSGEVPEQRDVVDHDGDLRGALTTHPSKPDGAVGRRPPSAARSQVQGRSHSGRLAGCRSRQRATEGAVMSRTTHDRGTRPRRWSLREHVAPALRSGSVAPTLGGGRATALET